MVKYCSAYGCKNEWTPSGNIKFHRFPHKRPAILKLWITAMRRENFKPSLYTVICSDHFTSNDYVTSYTNAMKLLKKDAVPSIFNFPKHLQKPIAVRRLVFRQIEEPRKICDISEDALCSNIKHDNTSESTTREVGVQTSENKMDSTCADINLSNNNSKIQDEFDNCTDDKVCVYQTAISGGHIKQEPCDTEDERGYIKQEPYDTEDEQGNIHDYADIKNENIDDPTVIMQETKLMIDTDQNYFKCCQECGEEYDLYCLKCPMLIRIFDTNNPSPLHNRVRWTLPKNFIDILETPSGVGMVALRPIPNGVVFGPFEGLDSIKDGAVSKWKLKCNELAYTKDPKWLNWMQYIRRADRSCPQNLTPFQYEDALYYRSDCHISVGDELLVCWNSDNEESMVEDMEDSYLKPRVCERLDDTYACTLCCVGYKSVCHLAAHNSSCPGKGNEKDFCKEIIQCAFCKIYLDEKEYSDYHIDRCSGNNPKKYVAASRSQRDTDNPEVMDKYKCSMCEYSTSRKHKFRQHLMTHADLRRYKCPKCPYQTCEKYRLQEHMRTHVKCSSSRYVCEHCGDRFTRSDLFGIHQKKKHFAYKCDKCVFETTNALELMRHMATHDVKPYLCNMCGKQFKTNNSMLAHVRISHNQKKKEYKCPKCDFETRYSSHLKTHLLNMHSGVKRFKCPRCPFTSCYKSTIDRHLLYHEDVKPVKCESCDIEFRNIRSLASHEKIVHAMPDETYYCCKCKYRTHNKYALDQHLARMHDGPKIFACTLCPYRALRNSSLKRHIDTHNNDETYKCSKCDYRTRRKRDFKWHLKAHDDPNLSSCTLCSYKTTKKSALKRHIGIHNDDKPFKCDMCPMIFKLKSNLTRHLRNIHTQAERMEYKCPQCPFETKYKANMKLHTNTHNERGLFQCSKCDFGAHHKGHLTRHIKRLHATKVKDEKHSIVSDE